MSFLIFSPPTPRKTSYFPALTLKKNTTPIKVGVGERGVCMWFNSKLLLGLSGIKFRYISVLC